MAHLGAGAGYRNAFMEGHAGRAINVAFTAEEAKSHPLVMASHDMGAVSYTYFMVIPLSEPPPPLPPDQFACPFQDIVRWVKANLHSEQLSELCQAIVNMFNAEQLHKQSRVKGALIEAQLGTQNPRMYALSGSVMTNYYKQKTDTGCQFPESVVSVGAQSKFSLFFLKTPTGLVNYDNRKRLSVLILEFLFDQWNHRKVLRTEWFRFYSGKMLTGSDKKDDYADAALQLIAYLMEVLGIALEWEALEALYTYLRKDPRFGPVEGYGVKNKWPLAFTAEGEEAFRILRSRTERELASAVKKLSDKREVFATMKRQPTQKQRDRLQELTAALALCRQKKARVDALVACHAMVGKRETNKESLEGKVYHVHDDTYIVNGKAKKRKTKEVDPCLQRESELIKEADKKRRSKAPTFAGESTAPTPSDYGVELEPDVYDLDAIMARQTGDPK